MGVPMKYGKTESGRTKSGQLNAGTSYTTSN